MQQKKTYDKLKMQVVLLDGVDVICASQAGWGWNDLDDNEFGDFQ